ncbi:hypothetical protein N657DRAFT_442913 [Parathielavia appendiculata]|uniref:Uncharacterized protein n=1 Tax=Parathielavia appendiculata TaxID=2587402 RepID=A0AAN6TPP6_9PEZI|nr:hypothetical protein N657DRAFT_442913 [Parathielavia appendiculata]
MHEFCSQWTPCSFADAWHYLSFVVVPEHLRPPTAARRMCNSPLATRGVTMAVRTWRATSPNCPVCATGAVRGGLLLAQTLIEPTRRDWLGQGGILQTITDPTRRIPKPLKLENLHVGPSIVGHWNVVIGLRRLVPNGLAVPPSLAAGLPQQPKQTFHGTNVSTTNIVFPLFRSASWTPDRAMQAHLRVLDRLGSQRLFVRHFEKPVALPWLVAFRLLAVPFSICCMRLSIPASESEK